MSKTPLNKGKSLNKHLKASPNFHFRAEPRHQKVSPSPKNKELFESANILKHTKKASFMSDREQIKVSNKVLTTDQSNNCQSSKLHQSGFTSEQYLPNQEYFHQPLAFKQKKRKSGGGLKGVRRSKLYQLQSKLDEMNQLVHSQQKELKGMRDSLNQKQLQRLTKIHSIQKLHLVEEMRSLKNSTKRSRRI